MRNLVLAAAFVGVLAGPALAAVIRVPQDFGTIQAAVDAAFAGDKIIIKRGTYNENVVVNAKPDLMIRGTGLVTINGGAGIAIAVGNSSNVRIKGVSTISTSSFGVVYVTSENGYVSQSRMQGFGGVGAINANGLQVAACRIASTSTGLAFLGTGTQSADRVIITSAAAGQAIVAASETVNLTRCKVTYTGVPTQSPIEFNSSVRGFAERCRVRTAPAAGSVFGIDLQPSAPAAQFELNRNRIEGCRIGIAGSSVNNVTCFGNIITASKDAGIAFQGVSYSIERNKVLLGAGAMFGIYVTNSTNTTVTANKVQGAGAGVFMGNGSGNTIAGNKLKNLTVGVTLSGNANTIGPNNTYKNVTTPINDGGTNTIILDSP